MDVTRNISPCRVLAVSVTNLRTVALALLLIACPARADEATRIESDFFQLNTTEHRLMISLLANGALSLGAGAGMMIPGDNDQAFRVAGGVTLAFGAINLVLGITGTLGTARERRNHRSVDVTDLVNARRDLVASAHKKALVFGINLGLDVGYAMGGSVAMLASALGVDHPDRWLAGGTAVLIQGVALAVIDLVGVLAANQVKF
jgi:hypothetical protein